jgi:peroxiredoxin
MTNTDAKIKLKDGLTLLILLGFMVLMFRFGFHHSPETVPDLTMTTINGKNIRLVAQKGKPMIVTFWATSCSSCLKEIPDLVTLYNRFRESGVQVIAIAMTYDPPNHVVHLSRDKNLPYDVVLDVTGNYARAFGGVQAIPALFVIAPDGKVIKQELGRFDLNVMTERLNQLLQG